MGKRKELMAKLSCDCCGRSDVPIELRWYAVDEEGQSGFDGGSLCTPCWGWLVNSYRESPSDEISFDFGDFIEDFYVHCAELRKRGRPDLDGGAPATTTAGRLPLDKGKSIS